jgi:two-component system sensor histidine kinase KdpD
MKGAATKPESPAAPSRALDGRAYAGSLGMVAVALLIGLGLHQLGITNVALVFLTAVLVSAITYGLWPSLFACFAAILAYNFFFMPPLYTFTISDPDNVVALFFFTVIALIASYLSARMRAQAIATRERATMTENLYLFSQKLAGVFSLDDLLWATAFQIAQMLKVRVVILLPAADSISVRAGYPPEDVLDEADMAAAKWAWGHAAEAGRGADTLPGAKRLFLPMRTGRGIVGIIGLDSDREGPLLSPDQRRLFNALADQASVAIERIHLAQEIDKAHIASEAERLRAALLTSISHDLRTPLAGILGSATMLRSGQGKLDKSAEADLLATIQEEAERLNRFIANLLDMTRLESGAIQPRLDEVDIGDVVGSALRRAEKVLAQHSVEVDIAANLPPLRIDPVLFEQVLFNLLDNAAKYAPRGTRVRLSAVAQGGRLRLEIMDEGRGIPAADLEHIFDKFYRVQAGDRQRAGTGLGLPICRGFVEAMGGTITAANRSDRSGAVFTVLLPLPVEDVRERAAA